MELNHHILAKATTDAILENFKKGKWVCCGTMGKSFFRVGCDASFPAPDAAFADDETHALACFEFKPPTETKRGILTGVGQSIAYLQNCDLAFLIAPQMLGDFRLGDYLSDLYARQITNKIPAGLILYDNNDPSKVVMERNVDAVGQIKKDKPASTLSRFWAKHQDLPVELFHLLLHCYYLRKVHVIEEDAFVYCWNHFLISPDVVDTRQVRTVLDCAGNPVRTLRGNKRITFLDKKLKMYSQLPDEEQRMRLAHDIDVTVQGDSYYNSIRKNYVTFLKHLGMIDSEYDLTDEGYSLYHIGVTNGPGSRLFRDYFTKTVLLTGHHLDLILDLEAIRAGHATETFDSILKRMKADYERRGLLKRNPGRQVGGVSTVQFLKYELILWKALGLVNKDYVIDWRRITEICLLPD